MADNKYILIACCYRDIRLKELIGFRLMDKASSDIRDVSYQSVAKAIASNIGVDGIELDENGALRGANGAFSRYSPIVDGEPVGDKAAVIISKIEGKGYIVASWTGKVQGISEHGLINEVNNGRVSLANAKIVNGSYGQFISSISGSHEILEIPAKKEEKVEPLPVTNKRPTETSDETKKARLAVLTKAPRVGDDFIVDYMGTPESERSARDFVVDKEGTTAEQKFTRALRVLSLIRPLYYGVLTGMRRVITNNYEATHGTMGVSTTTLYMSPEFIRDNKVAQLVFVLAHEVCHIVMGHNARMKGRDPEVWNWAGDFYINKFLAEEFKLSDEDVKNYKVVKVVEDRLNEGVAFGMGGLYDASIDTKTDTVEGIYSKLQEKINEGEEQSSGGQGDGGEGSGDGSGSGSESSGGSEESDDMDGNDQESQEDSENPESNEGEGQQKPGGGGTPKSGKNSKSGEQRQGKGYASSSGEQENDGDSSINDRTTKKEKEDGRKEKAEAAGIKPGTVTGDLRLEREELGKSEEQMMQQTRAIMESALVYAKSVGASSCNLEREMLRVLAPKIDWRRLVHNLLLAGEEYYLTYTRPDKRFLTRDMLIPGKRLEENDLLRNVWFCVDTSGSIDMGIMSTFVGQAYQLCKLYKVEGNILFWDTQVQKSYIISSTRPEDIFKVKPAGGGGTEPSCIYKYIDYQLKKCQYEVAQFPPIIVILTDGAFGQEEIKKYKSKYRNTIWVLEQGQELLFNAPFGKVAKFKDSIKN